MSFLFFVAIVIMAVYLRKQHNQINELKNRMQDLDYKLYYNYHLIRNMPNHNASKQAVRQENQDYKNEQYVKRPNTAPPPAAERPAQQQVPLSVRLSSIESVTKPTQNHVIKTEIQKNPLSECTVNQPSQVNIAADHTMNQPLQTNTMADHTINQPLQVNASTERTMNQPSQVNTAAGRTMNQPLQTNTADERTMNQPLQVNTAAERTMNQPLQTNTAADYKTITHNQTAREHSPVYSHVNSGISNKPIGNQSVTQSFDKVNIQPVGQNEESPKANKKSIESWLGSHVFNLIASLLIFIGLICLGTLVYEYITDTVKIIAMYLISGGIVALGTVLTKKHRNYFSLGLAGCGCGALFISVLLTHIYFNAISDVTAFSLLIVWTGFTLFISKKVDSVLLSVTAHAGMAISVCFAFSLGFSQTRIILPVIYQIVSIAVIVVGNIFCCKKTYRFGLLMSMTLLVYSSSVMNITLSNSSEVLCGLSVVTTALLFAVQTVGISFISYLLSVSTTKLYEDKEKLYSVKIPIIIHIVNKIIWSVGIFVSVGQVMYTVLSDAYGIDNYVYPLTAVCVVTLLHLAVTLFVSEKLNFNERLSNISIWSNSLIISLLLIMQCMFRDSLHGVSFIFVYAALMILIVKYTKNVKLNPLISYLLSADALFMTIYGYRSLANADLTVLSVLYLAVMCAIIYLYWLSQSKESKEKHLELLKTVEYLWVSISSIAIITCSLNEFAVSASLIALAVINILAYIFKYSGEENNYLDVIVKIESYLILYTGFIEIAGTVPTNKDNSILLFAVRITLILLCIVLFACTSVKSVKSQSTFRQLFTSLTFTCFVTAFCLGFSNILSPAYVYSNILDCKPFFLVFAASSLVIFVLSKNKNLNIFILSSMAVDAFTMILFGYLDLIKAKRATLDTFGLESISKTVNLNLTFVCIIHLAVICAMLFCLWYFQTEEIKKNMLLPLKTAEYCWFVFSLTEILLLSVKSVRIPFVLIILCAVNIIAYVLKYGGKEKNYLNIIIQITSFVILYLAFIEIAFKIAPNSDNLILRYTLRVVLIMMCAALYLCAGSDLAKSKDVGQQIFMGLTFTIFVNTVCCGLSSILTLTYVFSIICMVTALFCVIVGFILQAKGLRLYGLFVIILCVLKLVTIDISSANSISRVVAFIVGGIICFAISGIYNRFERLYGLKSETTENTK